MHISSLVPRPIRLRQPSSVKSIVIQIGRHGLGMRPANLCVFLCNGNIFLQVEASVVDLVEASVEASVPDLVVDLVLDLAVGLVVGLAVGLAVDSAVLVD